MTKPRFKLEHPLEKRKEVSSKIRAKYPECIPVIVEKAPGSDLPEISKKKFLVPQHISVGKFLCEIRTHMNRLSEETAIFLFINNFILTAGVTMSDIYSKYKDEDGFLYIMYSGESTFGMCTVQLPMLSKTPRI